MTAKRLAIFIIASILLHVFLLVIFQVVMPLLPKPAHEDRKKSVKVTLVPKQQPPPPPLQPAQPLPKQPEFVDTSHLPETKDPNPNTPLESEKSTKASSATPGEGNPLLPNQQGVNVPGLDLVNTKASPPSKGEPAPPAPKPDETVAKTEPQQKTETKEKPDPKLPVDPKESKQAPQVKPVDPIPLRPDADIQLTKAQPDESPKPDPNPTPKTQQPPQSPNPRSPPPPAQLSFDKQQNTINGGASKGAIQSVDSKETELGRYKAKLFRGIGSRWYIYVQQDNGQLGIGKVKIRFYVRSDGVITNLEILEGKENSSKLAAISRRSIMEISGQLEPFSEALKVQLGDGYTEEVTFSIY